MRVIMRKPRQLVDEALILKERCSQNWSKEKYQYDCMSQNSSLSGRARKGEVGCARWR